MRVIGKDVLAKKVGGDPVSFEYRSYHRSKVELFSTNRVQVMIVVFGHQQTRKL